MSDNAQQTTAAPIEQDGTLDSAVLAMPDIESLERANGHHQAAPVRREPDGKFAPKAEAQPEAKPAEAAAPAQAQAPAEDDEDFIEIPGEAEGAEPARHKLSEVLDGWQKSKQLETEIAELRKAPPRPAQYEQELLQTVQARQNLLTVLQELEATALPPQPSFDMTDPNSPNFDPAAFHAMARQYQSALQQRQQVKAAREYAAKEQEEQSRILAEAQMQREMAKVEKIWPEWTKADQREQIAKEVERVFGVPASDVAAVFNAGAVQIIKDALEFRKGRAAQETAVRAVKAKPKLVRATARETQTSNQARYTAAAERLSQSHSLEDAAEAIGALLR